MTLRLGAVILYGWQIAGIFSWRLLGSDRACCQSLRLGLNSPDYAIWKNTNTHTYTHIVRHDTHFDVSSPSSPSFTHHTPWECMTESWHIKYKTIIASALINEVLLQNTEMTWFCPNVDWQIRHVSMYFFFVCLFLKQTLTTPLHWI